MAETVQCATHGETERTYVCSHLASEVAGLGFNRDEPSEEIPFPDAWCDDCEVIRAAHGGWNDESHRLLRLALLCAKCYERARIRNTHTGTTLEDLVDRRWKCTTCEEWHTGPCFDLHYDAPMYWTTDRTGKPGSFLNEDYCVIDDRDFFVRGLIMVPIIGTLERFCWGVWGSLSKKGFDALMEFDAHKHDQKPPPMFSWLSNNISGYPNTQNMKMLAHIQPGNERPHFELERTDHPLSIEYHNGITPERLKEIMNSLVREWQ